MKGERRKIEEGGKDRAGSSGMSKEKCRGA
jgi:hypothetical protein